MRRTNIPTLGQSNIPTFGINPKIWSQWRFLKRLASSYQNSSEESLIQVKTTLKIYFEQPF